MDEDWTPCFVDVEKGLAFFDGIFIEADSMNNPRWDRVLPIVEEEHILMCREMKRRGRIKQGQLAIDIGTGNGSLAIWAAKHGCKVLAVDINPRAISIAKNNGIKNHISIYESFDELLESPSSKGGVCFSLEEFNENFNKNCLFDLVLFVPAYNLAFKGINLPLHASAGDDGQKAFNKYIRLIPSLLKDNGCLIGNHLSTVNHQKNIKAISSIISAFENRCQISYAHIISSEPYYSTANFLKAQYQSFLNKSNQQYLAKIKNIQELEEYINGVATENPYLSLIYYEVVKNNQIETEGNEPVILTLYSLPSYITWEHRIWLHRHIVEYTAERNYSLVHSLFLDVFPVNYPECEVFNYESNNNQWQNSLLKRINDYLMRKKSWSNFNNLFDIVLIDTAPMQNNIQGYKSLSNEMKIFLNQSLQNVDEENNHQLNHNLLKQYQITVATLQRAKVAPFLHPCFTGILPIEDWGLSYPFTFLNKEGEYINLYSQDEINLEKKYEIWVESIKEELKNDENIPEILSFTIDKIIGYSSINFKELSVPRPSDFYKELLNNKRFPKSSEYKLLLKHYDNSLIKAIQDSNISLNIKEDIINLLKIDLELITLTMHKEINKGFSDVLEEFNFLTNFNSILIGLPLGVQLDNKEITEDELPDSYRGCIWFYASTSGSWTIDHERFINDLAKFSWLLYMDKYSLDIQKLEQEKAKKATSAKLAFLHQLPKDVTALNESLSSYEKKIKQFQYQHPNLEVPKFFKPDSLEVMLMFTKAAQDQQLFEMPKDCAEILYGEWSQEKIQNFVNRVVWTQAKNRALNYPEVRDKGIIDFGVIEIDKRYLKPRLIIEKNFRLNNPQGIYPLVLITLRSAYQHSYLMTLLSENSVQGEIKIEYDSEELIITNTGLQPTNDMESKCQKSWEKDLYMLKGLTNKWQLVNFGNEEIIKCSIYDHQIHLWITKIVRK